MCGRYATTTNPGRLAAELDAIDETESRPNSEPTGEHSDVDQRADYNVAPTSRIVTVVERHEYGHADELDEATRRIRRMRWGLVPHWTKAAEPGIPTKGKPLFNARAETAANTPSFRDAVKYRRCLVPMDGWYEWLVESDPAGPGKNGTPKVRKRPHFMSYADGSRLYMAGLWSVWRDRTRPDSAPLLSCTILTTDSVGELTRVHDRMPLPMPQGNWSAWLDPDHPAPAALLRPPDEELVAGIEVLPVSTLVNKVGNNGPELLEPVTESGEQTTLL